MKLCSKNAPFIEACELWQEHAKYDLKQLVDWCAAYGLVYSASDSFICARPWKFGTDQWLAEKPYDTWLILMATSIKDMKRFFALAPYKLPKVAFHRHGALKCYNWADIKDKVYATRPSTSSQLLQRDGSNVEGTDRPSAEEVRSGVGVPATVCAAE